MDHSELRQQAIKRLEEKRDFRQHLAIYLLVNAGLSLIWFITNSDGYFWPVWPMFGWGIGVFAHAYQTYGVSPIAEAEIEREMRNLSSGTAGHGEASSEAADKPERVAS